MPILGPKTEGVEDIDMPLHLKYRPKTLEEFYGNDSVVQSLQTILIREDKPRAYLFTGPSGCGKTTLARIVAKSLGCDEENQSGVDRDYHELNISNARGIDDARKIMESMAFYPQAGPVRVFVLDEVQQATGPFQQSILKALEDTPQHVVFILCTTDPDKLLKTIRNRCSTFQVRPLPGPTMHSLLSSVLTQEKVTLPKEAIQEIINAADGSPRQALVILDQVIDIADDTEMIEAVRRTTVAVTSLKDLMRALLDKRDWAHLISVLNGFEDGTDWEKLRWSVLGYADKVFKSQNGPWDRAAVIIHSFKDPLFHSGKAGFSLACWVSVL